ncbi:FemAB family XrtA/PEP-CTERM system-associated protein [Alteromonas gilva]|uniref:FemAB family PEP-CTERM system-associated protein n=1 Tax=Alteromonas gilva TaxID=2987522 RepID=A0ABT5L0B7_9ALTE|nr:FemAB family XrtA/PEP-CTERM system-associated protein [Alteromonas gilva]MDC8830323.1 FemAB family PEP-CTERM system-associated protein [Alteromonas gilva]
MCANHITDYEIVKLESNRYQEWDQYVVSHDEGSFFHLSGWKTVIEETFKHQCHFLFARQHNDIIGILPLVEQKSRLFGHTLVSTPFCVYGGAIANSEAIRIALEDAALRLGQRLAVDYVELRYRKAVNNPNFTQFCHHSTFGLELATTPDDILASIKKKQRAVIRHSLKNDLSYRIDKDVDVAYQVYSESVRNLGTPVFDKKYFTNLSKAFADQLDVLTVTNAQNEPVSAVLSFYFKGEVLPYYGGGLHEARALKSNDFMYYQLMCHAQRSGCRRFDFGRSKDDSGSAKYKASYGITPEPLHYLRALVRATEQPNLSPNNPKYALFINGWKRLPLWLSRILGPYLSKYLG